MKHNSPSNRSMTSLEPTIRVKEEIFNGALASAIKKLYPQWEVLPETTGLLEDAKARLDILVRPENGPAVVLETSYQMPDAEKDAAGRLGKGFRNNSGIVLSALAVHVPPVYASWPASVQISEVEEELRNGQLLNFALYQLDKLLPSRWPSSGALVGTIADLANFAVASAVPMDEFDRVGNFVSNRISDATKMIDSVKDIDKQLVSQGSPVEGNRTIMLYWLDSIMTQRRLYRQGVRAARMPDDGVLSVYNCWYKIRKRNWHSIFDPAIRTLKDTLQFDAQIADRANSMLHEAVLEIEKSRLGERIEIGAEIYPKLTEDRKTAAAFYTRPAAAELLATLAIRDDSPTGVDWASKNLFRRIKFADLACGTGTLLRAGYRRIASIHAVESGVNDRIAQKQLHKQGMEGGLIGTDISPIAAHLTTTTLAALGSGDTYGDTQIGWVKVGGQGHEVGSLEFLAKDFVMNLFDEVIGTYSGLNREKLPWQAHPSQNIAVPDNEIDIILMNPPYSRTRGGQSSFDVAGISESERKLCQKRWSRLLKNEQATSRAGLAASFIALALKKLRKGGTMGFVLPLTAAFNPTWEKTRKHIEKNCTNIVAVAVLAGSEGSFSADTNMEEMLLVAQKRSAKGENCSNCIRCVTLKEHVRQMGIAGEVGRAILRVLKKIDSDVPISPILAGSDQLGYASFCQVTGEGAPWAFLGVAQSDIAVTANDLVLGASFRFGNFECKFPTSMVCIKDIFEIGFTHHTIGSKAEDSGEGVFDFYRIANAADELGKDRSLWDASWADQRSLVIKPTHYGIVRPNIAVEEVNRIRESAGCLHYARNLRWTSQSLLASCTENSVLGGRSWTTLKHEDARINAAFALWANSTLGMLVHWTRGSRTQQGRAATQIDAVKNMTCPNFNELESDALDYAARKFTKLSRLVLKAACMSFCDENRWIIDNTVLEMLGMESANEMVRQVRRVWCSEPSVHGGKKSVIAELEKLNT